MPEDVREPYTRRYEEEEVRNRPFDRPRYESGRFREPSRLDYGGGEYGREREYESFGRRPHQYAEGSLLSAWQRGVRENSILMRLNDTDLYVPDRDDVRGRDVIDQHGNDIGSVHDLIIDPQEQRVRFLQVTSGGFLGIGGTMMLIPIEAVTRVTDKIISIDQQSTRGFRRPGYNPSLIDRRTDWDEYRVNDPGYPYSSRQQRGRGPRGYRRSDDRIREDVNDRLSDRGDLDATDIEVTVVNCEVTLAGTVNNRRDKRLAEDLAENVSGVQNVENRLRVRQLGTSFDVSTAEKPGVAAKDAKASR